MSKCKVILLKYDGYYKTHDIPVRRLSGRLKLYASRMISMFHIYVHKTMYMSSNRYVLSYFATKHKLILSLNKRHVFIWMSKQAQQTPAHMYMYAYFLFPWKQLSERTSWKIHFYEQRWPLTITKYRSALLPSVKLPSDEYHSSLLKINKQCCR